MIEKKEEKRDDKFQRLGIEEKCRKLDMKKKIAVRCGRRKDKEKIMSNKNKLGEEAVYIDKSKGFKKKGKKIRIGVNKVTCEEEEWTWIRKDNCWFQKKREEEEEKWNMFLKHSTYKGSCKRKHGRK